MHSEGSRVCCAESIMEYVVSRKPFAWGDSRSEATNPPTGMRRSWPHLGNTSLSIRTLALCKHNINLKDILFVAGPGDPTNKINIQNTEEVQYATAKPVKRVFLCFLFPVFFVVLSF